MRLSTQSSLKLKPIYTFFLGHDPIFVILIFILCCTGMLMLYSASIDVPGRISNQAKHLLFAFSIMLFIANTPPQLIMRFALPLYLLGIGLLLAVAIFGLTKKGAQRWLDLGIFVIQPSELMKIAMPLVLAWYYQIREGNVRRIDHLVSLLMLIIPLSLIAKQPDLGTALLITAGGLFVIYFAGISFKIILPLAIFTGIATSVLLVFGNTLCQSELSWPILHDYQKYRICTLLDPNRDPLGKGFHTIQSIIAIGSGGLLGKGWLHGTQTHLEFIPEKHTDFIFSVISEEFGLIGGVFLLILYTLVILRGFLIASKAQTVFTRLLASGLTMTFFTYAFVNIGMVSGILPIVGVPLPMVSYGGTALVTLGIAAGIILSIAKQRHHIANTDVSQIVTKKKARWINKLVRRPNH